MIINLKVLSSYVTSPFNFFMHYERSRERRAASLLCSKLRLDFCTAQTIEKDAQTASIKDSGLSTDLTKSQFFTMWLFQIGLASEFSDLLQVQAQELAPNWLNFQF